jgi:hypothetical protein
MHRYVYRQKYHVMTQSEMNDAEASQEAPRISSEYKLRERHGMEFSPEPVRNTILQKP